MMPPILYKVIKLLRKGVAAMKVIIENEEDLVMIEHIQKGIMDRIKGLFNDYNIDISKIYNEDLVDLIIDIGRLGYEYGEIIFAIDNYERKVSNKVEINTNQFCNEEDI